MTNNLHKGILLLAAAGVSVFLPGTGLTAETVTAASPAAMALQGNGGLTSDLDDVRLKVGDVDIHPHLSTSFTYDYNLNIASGQNHSSKQGDFYAVVTPGVQLQYGKGENTISLDYQAAVQEFFRLSTYDTTDHTVLFAMHLVPTEKLKVDVSQGYTRSTGDQNLDQNGLPVGQIGERIPGTRVKIQNFTTSMGAEYEISQKTAIGAIYTMSFVDYIDPPGLIGSDSYDFMVPFYYHLSDKTDLFLYGDVGLISVDKGANQNQEGFGIGIRTRLTGKITGSARLGYQHTDYTAGGISSVNTVVASANGTWTITPRTSLIVGAYRGQQPTAQVINNYYQNTTFDVRLAHKLLSDKLTLSAGGGYELDEYGQPYPSGVGLPSTGIRNDNYYYLSAQADYMIRKWWSTGVFYRYRSNGSTLGAYQFDDNMVSIYTRVSF